MQMGARYFMKKWYIFLRLNADDCSISASILAKPTTRTIRKHVASAAMGIMIELVKKSKKSSSCIPNMRTFSHTP